MSAAIEQNKVVEKQEQTDMPTFENISIENATYLQNVENTHVSKEEIETPNFEIDSIEVANPELFSDDEGINPSNNENENEKVMETNESSGFEENSETKEPEMFESSDPEEELEIPAFLRRQKN